jgi:hypothetical protein
MEEITQKLKKITESRNNKKIIYKQSNRMSVGLFVDDLSVK